MKIFVISLPDAAERRKRAARQLGEAGLAFEFFDAMRGEQVAAEGYFEHCGEEEWLLSTGHPMSQGEVAQNLVEQTRAICGPVDVFIKKFWVHGQPIYGLTPYTVTESTLSQVTYILHREKVPKGIIRSTKRFLRKCSWEVKRIRAARRMG